MSSDTEKVSPEVEANAWLAAERGWKTNCFFRDGTVVQGAFITATDENKKAMVIERVGERHLQPRLVFLREIERLDVLWS